VITSVPWPDLPLRLDGAELHEVYPLAPLGPHQALGVATATYRDSVHVGLLADPAPFPSRPGSVTRSSNPPRN
jgi:diacylglycerol O-acyltransferase / wax synthase